jgi:hypothetical protein
MALVRAFMLENFLAGEGQQQTPDREPCPDPALVVIRRCDLAVDKVPIELACELYLFVLEIDDLVIQPRADRSPDLVVSDCFGRILR